MADMTPSDAPEPDWMDSMLSSAMQLTAYDEQRLNTVMVGQFAGQATRIARVLSESGQPFNMMSLGTDAPARRTAVLRNPAELMRIVEAGYGEQGVRLLLGIPSRGEMDKWLKRHKLFDDYTEALRNSAYSLEQGVLEAYDAKLTPLENQMLEVLDTDNDPEDVEYHAYAVDRIAMLGKVHDATLKHLNAQRSMVMERAARLNPEMFGAARAQASGAPQARSIAININLGSPIAEIPRSVDPSVVEGSTVDTTARRVVQSFGVSLNATPEDDQ